MNLLPPANRFGFYFFLFSKRATIRVLTEHLNFISLNSKVNHMTKEKLVDCLLEKKSPFKFVFMIFMEDYSEVFEEVSYLNESFLDLTERDSDVDVVDVPKINVKDSDEKHSSDDIRQQWAHELRSQSMRHLSASFFIDIHAETEGDSSPLDSPERKLNRFSSSSSSEDDEDSEKKPKDINLKLLVDEDDDNDWNDEIKTKPIKGDAIKKEKKKLKIEVLEDEEDWEDSAEDLKSIKPLKSELSMKIKKGSAVKLKIQKGEEDLVEIPIPMNSIKSEVLKKETKMKQPLSSKVMHKSDSLKKLALFEDDEDWNDEEEMKHIKPIKGDAISKKSLKKK
jgi:hypothetical protein